MSRGLLRNPGHLRVSCGASRPEFEVSLDIGCVSVAVSVARAIKPREGDDKASYDSASIFQAIIEGYRSTHFQA